MATPYPRVGEILDPAAQSSIRLLWEKAASLGNLANNVNAKNATTLILNAGPATSPTDALTKAQADGRYLNIGLSLAGLIAFLAGQGGILLPWLLKQLEKGTSATTSNTLSRLTFYKGTLNPNTKPTLTAADADSLFWSTDFDRLYVWSVTDGVGVWEDAPGQPGRRVVNFWSGTTATIPTGWHLCDGASGVHISNPDGSVSSIVAPVLSNSPTARLFFMSGSVAATTGGSSTTTTAGPSGATVTPMYNGSNTGSSFVGASSTHTHQITGIDPPSITLLPIFRL